MIMMGRQMQQQELIFVSLEDLVPSNHLLKTIHPLVSFDFIYDILSPYHSINGRRSIDPVCMFKILLIGYLYGVMSERRLTVEIQLDLAYRWFCGFSLNDKIPDHSTFSKTRTRKWNSSALFQKVFCNIIKQYIEFRLIDDEEMVADGSYIPANVSINSWVDVEEEITRSMQSYLDCLDEELSQQPGFKKPPMKTIIKKRTTSTTDSESGYIHHGSKRGIGCLLEATVDCKSGIVTEVNTYPANEKESLVVLRHLENQILSGVSIKRVAL